MDTNQVALQKPQHLISLASASLLVDVEVKVWTATRQNRTVSDEVTTSKKASRDSGRFIENLLANDPDHRRILNYRQTVYNWLQRVAYDFAGSQRCLPQIRLPKFMSEYKLHEAEFHKLVDTFEQKYPSMISNMAFVQGDMFDRNNYPDVSQLHNKFSMKLFTADVPMHDWRCQISADLAEDLHNNYARQTDDIVNNILLKQSEQVVNVLTSLSHSCGVDEVMGKDGVLVQKRRKIYESTFEKAINLCETFREFNLTNNKELEDCRAALENVIKGVSCEMLKNNEVIRENVKEDIDDILAKFRPAQTALNQTEEVVSEVVAEE
jgi:hypothetical protein